MSRTRKPRSAEALRARVAAWCEARGGRRVSDDNYNSVLGGTIGGDYVVPTKIGPWVVHLPADDTTGYGFSINTRFTATGPQLPIAANRHSGKWNFPCVDDADQLFEAFTRAAERLVTEGPCASSS